MYETNVNWFLLCVSKTTDVITIIWSRVLWETWSYPTHTLCHVTRSTWERTRSSCWPSATWRHMTCGDVELTYVNCFFTVAWYGYSFECLLGQNVFAGTPYQICMFVNDFSSPVIVMYVFLRYITLGMTIALCFQVMNNCHRILQYTPVASFQRDETYFYQGGEQSGIFLACINDGFQVEFIVFVLLQVSMFYYIIMKSYWQNPLW